MILCYILAAILGLYSFKKAKYEWYIVSAFLIFSDFCGVLRFDGNLTIDIAYILMLLPLFFNNFGNSLKNDAIKSLTIAILLYLSLRFLFAVCLHEENWLYAFKVIRLSLFFFTYFTFSQLPNDSIEKSIRIIVNITIFCAINFIYAYLSGQTYHTTSLENRQEHLFLLSETPCTTVFSLAYLFFNEVKCKWQIFGILVLLLSLLLNDARGLLIGVFVALLIFLIYGRKIKYLVVATILIPLLLFAHNRVTEKSDSVEEIRAVLSSSGDDLNPSDGTFAFRLAVAKERWTYIIQKPSRFLFGVGPIHEDSPNNVFDFTMGSRKYDDQHGVRIQQIDTADIAFLSEIFRYGAMYVLLVFLLIYQYFRKYNKMTIEGLAASFALITFLCAGASSDYFQFAKYMFVFILVASIDNKKNIERSL